MGWKPGQPNPLPNYKFNFGKVSKDVKEKYQKYSDLLEKGGGKLPTVVDRTETVFDGEMWGLSNVYIFPEKNRHVRGVIWVIPGCDNPGVAYGDGSGFSAQNFAYDQIKIKINQDKIKQDDWVVVIGPRHEYSLAQLSSNAKDTFHKEFFNYVEHVDLCGCCKDEKDREFINVVIAMGDGANAVDFHDPTITNVVLADPILYNPDIPESLTPYVTIVHNPGNHDPLTTAGNATLTAVDTNTNNFGVNFEIPSSTGFNHTGCFAAALTAFAFTAITQLLATQTAVELEDLITEADMLADYDGELKDNGGVTADPASDPAEEAKETSGSEPAGCSDFTGPQIVITSDRLVFDAKADSILLSSNTHIGLSAKENVGIDAEGYFTIDSPEINLGLHATEPILLGDKTGDWLDGLVNAIQMLTYTNAGGPTGPAINAATLNVYKQTINTLKSPQNKTL